MCSSVMVQCCPCLIAPARQSSSSLVNHLEAIKEMKIVDLVLLSLFMFFYVFTIYGPEGPSWSCIIDQIYKLFPHLPEDFI